MGVSHDERHQAIMTKKGAGISLMDAGETRRRAATRRWWLVVLIVIVVLGLCVWADGYAWHRYRNQPVTVLERGESYGYGWELYAKTWDGYLCLGIAAPHGRQTMHTFAGDYQNTFMQACGFDNTETQTAESSTIDAVTWREVTENTLDHPDAFHGPFIRFAPAPVNAVEVRVAEHRTVRTHVLDRPGFPHVTYWYYATDSHGQSKTDGYICGDPYNDEQADQSDEGDGCVTTAYDAQGHEVPFGKDYRQESFPDMVRGWFSR